MNIQKIIIAGWLLTGSVVAHMPGPELARDIAGLQIDKSCGRHNWIDAGLPYACRSYLHKHTDLNALKDMRYVTQNIFASHVRPLMFPAKLAECNSFKNDESRREATDLLQSLNGVINQSQDALVKELAAAWASVAVDHDLTWTNDASLQQAATYFLQIVREKINDECLALQDSSWQISSKDFVILLNTALGNHFYTAEGIASTLYRDFCMKEDFTALFWRHNSEITPGMLQIFYESSRLTPDEATIMLESLRPAIHAEHVKRLSERPVKADVQTLARTADDLFMRKLRAEWIQWSHLTSETAPLEDAPESLVQQVPFLPVTLDRFAQMFDFAS